MIKFIYVGFRHHSFEAYLKKKSSKNGDNVFLFKENFTGNNLLTDVLALRRLYNSRLMPMRSNHRTTYTGQLTQD